MTSVTLTDWPIAGLGAATLVYSHAERNPIPRSPILAHSPPYRLGVDQNGLLHALRALQCHSGGRSDGAVSKTTGQIAIKGGSRSSLQTFSTIRPSAFVPVVLTEQDAGLQRAEDPPRR
jgi:hypothetical protein